MYENQDNLDTVEQLFDGFVSQRSAYDSIDTDEERAWIVNNLSGHPYVRFLTVVADENREMEAVRVVESPLWAAIVNEDGFVKVGDTLKRFTHQEVLTAYEPDEQTINDMKMWMRGDDMPLDVQGYALLADQPSSGRSLESQCSQTYAFSGRLFRVKGEFRIKTSSPGGSYRQEFIVRVEHSIRTAGIWFADKADVLDMDYQASASWGGGANTSVFDSGVVGSDRSSLEQAGFSCTDPNTSGGPCQQGVSFIISCTYFGGQGNSGISCGISYP